MRRVVDGAGVFADRLGEARGEVGDLHAPGDFRLGLAAGVQDRLLAFDLLPFEADVMPTLREWAKLVNR